MQFDTEREFALAFSKIHLITKEVIEEPFNPNWDIVVKKWVGTKTYLPPRCFAQIIDIRNVVPFASFRFNLLGYNENHILRPEEIIQMLHANQRALFAYQTYRLYELILESPNTLYGKGFVYSCIRSFRDKEGVYKRVHQSSSPIQYDANGRVAKYMSIYTLLGDYNGEPLENEFIVDKNYPEEQLYLNNWQKRIKAELLEKLGFSRRQEELILLMAHGKGSIKDYAETMRIQPKAVEKLRSALLAHARNLFPLNKFEKASHVIDYLMRQKII